MRLGVALLTAALTATACSSSSPEAASPDTDTQPESTSSTAPTSTTVASSDTSSTTAVEDPPTASLLLPEIASISLDTVLNQEARATVGGENTYYWPDGNIGTLTASDGSTQFFAANGSLPAQTTGTPLSPGDTLLTAGKPIKGLSSEFSYAAGGPVYRDEASGMVLLWYHAERHLDGDPANFHAAIGLARSLDDGASFESLGIIIEPNAGPDPAAPCCVDVGGAPVIVRDGTFHLWFRDRIDGVAPVDIQLATASAPVADVVAAALDGDLAAWSKHGASGPTDGIGGRSVPLEQGNPRTSWFDVAWHDGMQRYLMVIATHGLLTDPSKVELTSSTDGLAWSPRQTLVTCDCELTYPSFLDTTGPERIVGDELTIVYVETAATAAFRWQDTRLQRATVELTGALVTGSTAWWFDADDGGWIVGGTVAGTSIVDGALRIDADGDDPYLSRSGLGLSTDEFSGVRVVMSSEEAGTGQVFFTTNAESSISESRSVHFDIEATPADGATQEYVIDLAATAGWDGLVDTLRIDPGNQPGTVSIELIEVVPAS